VFVKSGPGRIGRVYVNAQYRAYTDASFTTRKPIAERWRHLGILGPVIHAEVGDTVKVVVKNNLGPAGIGPRPRGLLRQERRGRPLPGRHQRSGHGR